MNSLQLQNSQPYLIAAQLACFQLAGAAAGSKVLHGCNALNVPSVRTKSLLCEPSIHAQKLSSSSS